MKGWCMMKRNVSVSLMVLFVFCLAIISVGGCAKKAAVKEEAAVTQEKKEMPQAAPQVKGEDEEARQRALREKAEREKAEREAAMKKAAAEKPLYEFVDVNFDFDKYALTPQAREILKKHGDWLMKNTDYKVLIEGNCDERGTVEYNLALGERRAAEAKKYLVELGVADKRLSTISYGKERPLDPGHNEEAWAKNRRDHFVVTGTK